MQFNLNVTNEELDEFIRDLREGLGGDLANRIATDLDDQRPGLPMPTNRQAVVRTADGSIWVLADQIGGPALAWFVARPNGNYDWRTAPDGKIVEVLYPGIEV